MNQNKKKVKEILKKIKNPSSDFSGSPCIKCFLLKFKNLAFKLYFLRLKYYIFDTQNLYFLKQFIFILDLFFDQKSFSK